MSTEPSDSSSSSPISIERMTVAPDQNPQSGHVFLQATLTPAPAFRTESWWWMKEVADGMTRSGISASSGAGPGGVPSFTLSALVSRDRLEEDARLFCGAIRAAISAYPERFLADQLDRDEQVRVSHMERRRGLEADQSIVDGVMEE
jgi:hypothetical protein